jgi:hypothetical protein
MNRLQFDRHIQALNDLLFDLRRRTGQRGLEPFALYGHLSLIGVNVCASLGKPQALGKTFEKEMASGDRLHFAVYLNDPAVSPFEWRDQK